jgi:hypothetical protein
MAFLFDGDEKREELRTRISAATGERAHFLEVRELENLFLSALAIHSVLAQLCSEVGLPVPGQAEVDAHLNEILGLLGDRALYPSGASHSDSSRVVGSEVLRRLYWKWALTEYDKVRDGVHLALEIKSKAPERLRPLTSIVENLGTKHNA